MNAPGTHLELFIDGVDWEHEIPNASWGNTIYYGLEDLKEHNKCWKECGVVKVTLEVKKVEWVEAQNFGDD